MAMRAPNVLNLRTRCFSVLKVSKSVGQLFLFFDVWETADLRCSQGGDQKCGTGHLYLHALCL